MGNYSGKTVLVEECPKIEVSDVLQEAKQQLLPVIMQNVAEISGYPVEFTTSKLAHGGERIWFKCPLCKARSGVLYKKPLDGTVGCRSCLELEYRSRRYRGMIENNL
jgi:hypothetical protein